MGEVADLYVTLRANTAQFTSGWAKAVATGETSAAKINAATGKIAKYSVLGLAGIAVASVKMAGDFSDSINRIDNLAMGGKGNVQQLSNVVLDLAGKVGFSPQSLAEALYHVESNFYSVGMGGKQAFQALQVAAEGAKVGGADLVDVTNALGAVVAAAVPGTENYSKAMGTLLATVGSGDMTMQNLADAFSTGLPAIARTYNVTLSDMGAALATFGDDNIRGQVAATDLRMAIQDLSKQGKPGVAALESIGIGAGQLRRDLASGGLKKALEDLKTHLDDAGLSGKQMGGFLQDAFTKKSSAPMAILMGQMDRFESKFPALQHGADKFGSDWTSQTHQFKQIWASFVGQFEADLTAIGLRLLPTATSAIHGMTDAFTWLGSNIGTILTLGEYLAAGAAGFYALKVATLAWSAIQWISSVAQGAAAFVSLATEIRSAKEAQVLLSMAITDTPWGAVASLVGVGMLAAFKLFHKGASDASKDAQVTQQSIDNLRFSYDKLTGSITATSLAQIQQDLGKKQFTVRNTGVSGGMGGGVGGHQGGYVEAAASLGIQSRVLDLALRGNAQALDFVDTRLAALSKGYGTSATTAQQLKAALADVTGNINANADAWREKTVEETFSTAEMAKIPGALSLMTAPLISTAGQLQAYAAKWHWSADQVRAVATGELVPITKTAVDQVISNLAKLPPGIAAQQPATNAATKTLANGVLGPLNGLRSLTSTAGQNAALGFASGMVLSLPAVTSAADLIAVRAVNKMNQVLAVHSPSRVTMQIGSYFGQGLADGIASESGRVINAAQALAQASVKAVATAPTGTATRVRRESAKKALSMDLPTYLEAAAAAGYTTSGRAAVHQPFVIHLHNVTTLDGRVVAKSVQKQVLTAERRGTSNGLSRRRSAKV